MICRDRARYYAEGADRGAGTATQVADRFHLWKNLGEAAERWDAVTADLTLRWNSGPVEGHVNRIKMLKRQMFGRAKLDLLRTRVLLAS